MFQYGRKLEDIKAEYCKKFQKNVERTFLYSLLVFVVAVGLVGGEVIKVSDETDRVWSEGLFALTCLCNKHCSQTNQGNGCNKVPRFSRIDIYT